MVYFLQQIQEQFFFQCVNYQEAPGENGPRGEERPPEAETLQNPADLLRWGEEGVSVARSSDARLQEELGILAQAEIRDQELSTLAENITPSESERALLGIEAETELNTEQRREILEARLAEMSERELTHDGEEGPRRIIEAAYVAEIAEEVDIDPQLLMDLRAADFEGAMSWEEGEVMGNYELLLQDIQNFAEIEGIDVSQLIASEYMRLYQASQEALQTLDPAAAVARGIDVRRDPNGGFQINPETPGYTQLPNGAVVGPPGSPSSFEGRVYQGQPSEFFGGNVVPRDMGPGGAETNYDNYEVSEDNLMIHEGDSPGQEALENMNLSPEVQERVNEIMGEGFFPILMSDGSVIFVNNPSYAADRNGDGVSAQEAQDYEQANPDWQLVNFVEADAARQQAHVIGAMQTYPNQTPDPRYRELTQQRLQGLQDAHPDRLIGGVGKIMGRNAQGQIGMVGGIRDIANPDRVWQASNETGRAHAGNPEYADYSQMVQVRHKEYLSPSGELLRA